MFGPNYGSNPTVRGSRILQGGDAISDVIRRQSPYPPSGWVLLNTLNASNSPTLDDTSSFTKRFDVYKVIVEDMVPVTNNVWIGTQVYINGILQTNNYAGAEFAWTSSAATGAEGTTGIWFALTGTGTNIAMMSNTSSVGYGLFSEFTVFSPNNSGIIKRAQGQSSYLANGNSIVEAIVFQGWCNNTNAGQMTGIRFLTSSGNILRGTVKIYGVTKL